MLSGRSKYYSSTVFRKEFSNEEFQELYRCGTTFQSFHQLNKLYAVVNKGINVTLHTVIRRSHDNVRNNHVKFITFLKFFII
jgi:hypothetical protein